MGPGNTFRRASTAVVPVQEVANLSLREGSRRASVADTPRRPSLASLSLRLTRSKRTNSSSIAEQSESRLGELFFSLPSEIQSQILCYLDCADVFSLRLTSLSALNILHISAPTLNRSILQQQSWHSHLPYIQYLFPQPIPCLNTHYLLQTLHRQNVVYRMTQTVVAFIQMKIYMIRSGPRLEQFGVYRERLFRKLYKPAWTICHYLENYRQILLFEHPKHPQSRFWGCPECKTSLQSLVAKYPPEDVVPAFQFYQLSLLHLKASTRAPTYAGTIERRLRGWSRKAPSEDDLAQVIILGGIEQLSRLTIMKGTYNERLEMVGSFADKFASAAAQNRIAFGLPGGNNSQPRKEVDAPSDVIHAINPPLTCITEEVLESLPDLDEFFVTEWTKRIVDEDLVEHERELTSPFGYIQRIMAGDQCELALMPANPQPWQPYVPTAYG